MIVCKPKICHAKEIQQIVNTYAKKDLMLAISLNELYENIRDFWVCIKNDKVIGVCALKILWEDLAEIRSLAVLTRYQKKGIAKTLVKTALNEASELGVSKVFALTYQREFFAKQGFREIPKSNLPQKIWTDCLKCPKFPSCDEIAMLIEL